MRMMETEDSQQPPPPPPPPSPSEEGMEEADGDEDGGLPLGDDPVVREIPVYLSTELAQQLHVIQYPNRPFYRPYGTPVAARVKPANKLLELEYALPLSSEHLDEEAPRHLRLERIKVQSSYLDAMTTYAVGTMRGEALHLTPLAGIYQMRASCEHVDAASEDGGEGGLLAEDEDSEAEDGPLAGSSSRAKAGAAAASSAAGAGGAAAPPVKLQHIEYKKRESEKAAAARRTSYAYKRQQEEAEAWTELGIHPQGSEASAQDSARLRCPEESTGRPIQFKGGSGVYVDLYRRETARARGGEEKGLGLGLAEGAGEVMVVDDDNKAAVLSSLGGQQDGSAAAPPEQRPAIQQLSGAEQVAAIFERASVVSFDMVLALANPNPFATPGALATLLELMKKHAMLVRGNFVRKSGLCGLPPRLAAARDALLLILERYGGVNRMQLARAAGLSDEEVLALLEPLARLDEDQRMWVAACPDDADFCRRHPQVATQQARAWRERERDRDVAAVLQAMGVPDCPFPGPVPGMEALTMEAGGGGKSAGAGGAKAAGPKGRRK